MPRYKKGVKYGWYWKHGEMLEASKIKCKLCSNVYSVKHRSSLNFKTHLINKHKIPDETKNQSWIWTYYKKVTELSAECKKCGCILEVHYKLENLKMHSMFKHDNMERTNWIGRHYTVEEIVTDQGCLLCGESLEKINNLTDHLREYHNEIPPLEIIHNEQEEQRNITWLRQFDITLEKFRTKCNICELVRERTYKTLLRHLKKHTKYAPSDIEENKQEELQLPSNFSSSDRDDSAIDSEVATTLSHQQYFSPEFFI